ncbi:MAG: hypothetical protein HY820_27435, partial [Acidobacteria bacterium]|nr:hypothetical protein [Acidobacteriota bacterium]
MNTHTKRLPRFSLYAALPDEYGLTVFGACREEAVNNLAEELAARCGHAVGQSQVSPGGEGREVMSDEPFQCPACCRQLLSTPITALLPRVKEDYRDLYEALTTVSLRRCPHCGSGVMEVTEVLAPWPLNGATKISHHYALCCQHVNELTHWCFSVEAIPSEGHLENRELTLLRVFI